ncbi:MAG: hypothetical protein GY799_14570 [Desulfobulbaceae bacterium]|nr:hypothetical protein [Desulfobulbaceae bacterium]
MNWFAKILLATKAQTDVDVLKIDVPFDASPSTEYKITKLARSVYYERIIENPSDLSKIGDGKTVINFNETGLDPDSDIYVFAIDKLVSVTPLSVDLTSRVKLSELQQVIGK